MLMLRKLVFSAVALCTSASVFANEGIAFTPGQWEITTKTRMPFMADAMQHKAVECIQEKRLEPKRFAEQSQGQCEVTRVNAKGARMDWDMQCLVEGSPMKGSGEITVADQTMQGRMHATTQMQGISMTINTEWTGKRLGNCP